ncbi:two-component system sensor kinase [[Actinomadura] parvosata subsp. kistnae]|uniref:sensor histidine kinase n=1 Tax=[Actinomadura] parvosata TaxID=1955412 RepID=UPI000D2ED8F0|nr:histidine kinase [Nonomuraea sp. ATCC 55076]SPL89003.1 two-component system sensor kinase [Actinomadura parvosata subsp. kistnae]
MITRWTERVLDDRAALVRLAGLTVLALGDLHLLHRPARLADWALALAGLALCLAGARLPLAATAALPGLLVVGDLIGTNVGVPLKAMLAVTLFELALRGRGRRVAFGAGTAGFLLTAHAMSSHAMSVPAAEVPPTLYRLSILLGVPLLLGAYVRLTRENARQARERAASLTLAARTAERTAIARELHDLVAHHVSSMVLRVGVARHVLPDADPRLTQVLDDLHASAGTALADLRRLVTVLRDPARAGEGPFCSPADQAALPDALEQAAARARATGLSVHCAIGPQVARLDAVRALTVLRLAQEGLANAAQHAGRHACARMTVKVEDDVVRLEIADDGGAARPGTRRAPGAGHGLAGMAERAGLLGGRFEAGPSGRGWRLYAELPPPPTPQPLPQAVAQPAGRGAA